MSRRVVDEINRLKECHGYLRGLVSLVGFKQTIVQFDRPGRFAGQTNYPIMGSIKIGLNGLLCFSTAALKWIARIELNIGDDGFWVAIRVVEPAETA